MILNSNAKLKKYKLISRISQTSAILISCQMLHKLLQQTLWLVKACQKSLWQKYSCSQYLKSTSFYLWSQTIHWTISHMKAMKSFKSWMIRLTPQHSSVFFILGRPLKKRNWSNCGSIFSLCPISKWFFFILESELLNSSVHPRKAVKSWKQISEASQWGWHSVSFILAIRNLDG